MKYFAGLSDGDRFRFLATRRSVEVNFWRLSADRPLARLGYGAPFLFNLQKSEHRIPGGNAFTPRVDGNAEFAKGEDDLGLLKKYSSLCPGRKRLPWHMCNDFVK